MILKLITFLFILYLVFRLVSFFFRGLFMVMGKRTFDRANHHQHRRQGRKQRPSDGNVIIEHVPPKDKKQQADFQGGEYVDYEEIKNK